MWPNLQFPEVSSSLMKKSLMQSFIFLCNVSGFYGSVSSTNRLWSIFPENCPEYLEQVALSTMPKKNLLCGQQQDVWER